MLMQDRLSIIKKYKLGQIALALTSTLLINSRIGERLEGYDTREVRRILVGQYEMRYEINNSIIYILRIWHAREDR